MRCKIPFNALCGKGNADYFSCCEPLPDVQKEVNHTWLFCSAGCVICAVHFSVPKRLDSTAIFGSHNDRLLKCDTVQFGREVLIFLRDLFFSSFASKFLPMQASKVYKGNSVITPLFLNVSAG